MATAADFAAALRAQFQSDPGVTKVHKLLYYCQGWHLAWTGEPAFDETIEAWEKGPVVADLWRAEKRGPAPEAAPLDDLRQRTVTYVTHRYGRLYASQLVGETHREDPWLTARAEGTDLSIEHMREFFAADTAADQAWFWSADWHAGELEADEDMAEGRTEVFDSTESFVESLRARRANA